MKKIYYALSFLFAISFSSLMAQNQLTSLSSGFISKGVEYVGTQDGTLYYVEELEDVYNLRSEDLNDNDLQSNIVQSFDRADYEFDSYALTTGKIVIETSESIIVYDILTNALNEIDLSNYFLRDAAVYAAGKSYIPISDLELLIIDLDTEEITVRNVDSAFSFDRFGFNDDTFNVLPDSTVLLFVQDKSQNINYLVEYNIVEGVNEILYTFDSSDFFTGPYRSNNSSHLPVANLNSGEYKLLSMMYSDGRVNLTSTPLVLDASKSVVDANEDFAISRSTEIVGGTTTYTYEIQDMVTGVLSTIVFADEDGLNIEYVAKTGVYLSQNNELRHLGIDGTETIIFDGLSDGGIYFLSGESFRNSAKLNDRFIANYRKSDGTREYILVDASSASTPFDGQIIQYIFDETTDAEYVITESKDFEFQLASFEAGIPKVTEDESRKLQGGNFVTTENDFIYTSNPAFTRKVYNTEGEFQSVSFANFNESYTLYTRVGDAVLATTPIVSRLAKKVDFSNETIDDLTLNDPDESAQFIFEIKDGVNYAKAVVSVSGSNQLASINSDGVITTFMDQDNPSNSQLLPIEPYIVTTMDLGLAYVGDFYLGNVDMVVIGGNLTETKSVFTNFDISSAGSITVLEEGQTWSYMSADRYFFIDQNGESVEALPSQEVPAYGNGKFYFSDKYFDESTGSFTDWESGLTSVELIKNGKAYGFQGTDLASVDLNTLTLTNLGATSADLEFYSGKDNVLFFDPNTNAVSWTDGTETGMQFQTLPSNLAVGEFRTSLGDVFLFSGMNETVGNELFTLSSEGEITTSDLNPGALSSTPSDFIVSEDFIYFQACNDENGFQIYAINVALALSTDDKDFVNRIVHLSPNPTSDLVTVDVDFIFETAVIYDQMGKLVSKQASNDNRTIDLRELQTGVYYIQLISTNGVTGTSKVLKK